MTAGFCRGMAKFICQVIQTILPPSLHSWGQAIQYETEGVSDDRKALLFALDCLIGLVPRVAAARAVRAFDLLIENSALFSGGSVIMTTCDALIDRPRTLGIVCSIGAVGLGIAYMAVADAPSRYLMINFGALAIGLTLLLLLGRIKVEAQQFSGVSFLAMAGALLATALFGSEAGGATRWFSLGGLSIQPSLILLPVLMVAFSQTSKMVATLGIVVAAVAIALQPDRAMAGVLMVGLAILVIRRRDWPVATALCASIAAFCVALIQADTLPAVPYVDQILYTSFDIHPVAGLAVVGGSFLLLVPAIVGWARDPESRTIYAVFAAVWSAVILAAALGNYPTPIVGYGGSAIIGYALSLLALPRQVQAQAISASQCESKKSNMLSDRHLLIGRA